MTVAVLYTPVLVHVFTVQFAWISVCLSGDCSLARLKRGLCCRAVSVRSVSVTFAHRVETTKYILILFRRRVNKRSK